MRDNKLSNSFEYKARHAETIFSHRSTNICIE